MVHYIRVKRQKNCWTSFEHTCCSLAPKKQKVEILSVPQKECTVFFLELTLPKYLDMWALVPLNEKNYLTPLYQVANCFDNTLPTLGLL